MRCRSPTRRCSPQLDALVGSLKPAQWKTYLRWRVGDAMAPYLAKPFRDAASPSAARCCSAQAEPAPRWQQTLDAINLAAGPMLGREYAARYLPDATRQQPVAIATQVRDALQRNVDNSTWLSEAAKPRRKAKLGKLGSRSARRSATSTTACSRWAAAASAATC
jgi:putative endopeptidase